MFVFLSSVSRRKASTVSWRIPSCVVGGKSSSVTRATTTTSGVVVRAATQRTTAGSVSSFSTMVVSNRNHGLELSDPYCNVTEHIASRVGVNLHQQPLHPLNTIKTLIEQTLQGNDNSKFDCFDDLSPVTTVEKNFDLLQIPSDHVSRQKTDTYYLTPQSLLRCHTSAHQVELLSQGYRQFLVTGDVYRRDEVDKTHYPVFHQMEGVKLFPPSTPQEVVLDDLKETLEGLSYSLFGKDVQIRWGEDSFPFTDPSLELEVYHKDDWLEVCGCGVIRREILHHAGIVNDDDDHAATTTGWAFGLGLERLAMVLFGIPDIRLFWTTDERFHSQFQSGDLNVTFQPYSKFPPCMKDISFWLPKNDSFHENDFSEIVREVAGDIVEKVELIDAFQHPKTGRTSHCYRIAYRSMDRSLTNQEIDALQENVRTTSQNQLGVELR